MSSVSNGRRWDFWQALTKVIEDFDAGAGRQDRGRIRMARAQAGRSNFESTGAMDHHP